MNKLTDTQDTTLQYISTEYIKNTWDNKINLLESNQSEYL